MLCRSLPRCERSLCFSTVPTIGNNWCDSVYGHCKQIPLLHLNPGSDPGFCKWHNPGSILGSYPFYTDEISWVIAWSILSVNTNNSAAYIPITLKRQEICSIYFTLYNVWLPPWLGDYTFTTFNWICCTGDGLSIHYASTNSPSGQIALGSFDGLWASCPYIWYGHGLHQRYVLVVVHLLIVLSKQHQCSSHIDKVAYDGKNNLHVRFQS